MLHNSDIVPAMFVFIKVLYIMMFIGILNVLLSLKRHVATVDFIGTFKYKPQVRNDNRL